MKGAATEAGPFGTSNAIPDRTCERAVPTMINIRSEEEIEMKSKHTCTSCNRDLDSEGVVLRLDNERRLKVAPFGGPPDLEAEGLGSSVLVAQLAPSPMGWSKVPQHP